MATVLLAGKSYWCAAYYLRRAPQRRTDLAETILRSLARDPMILPPIRQRAAITLYEGARDGAADRNPPGAA